MKINLYLRTDDGDRLPVGIGDPDTLLRSLERFGVEGDFPIVTGQWFYDEGTDAGFEAVVEAFDGGEA